MSNARNLARLIVDSGGDVEVSSLGNVPPSNDASALTTGTLGTARLPAGSVLQTVHRATSNQIVSYDTNHVNTDLYATITPFSASSKILVLMNPSMSVNGAGGANATCLVLIKRNNGLVHTTYHRNYDYSTYGLYMSIPICLSILDAPNTTSPLTYRLEFALNAGNNAQLNSDGGSSSVTLMEIAA